MAQNPGFNLVADAIGCGNESTPSSEQSSRSSTLESNISSLDLIYMNRKAVGKNVGFNLLSKDKTFTRGSSPNHSGKLRLAIPTLFAVLSLTISIILLVLILPMLSNETQSNLENLTKRLASLEAQLNQTRTENTYIYQTDVNVNVKKLIEEVNILNTTINNINISQAGNNSRLLEDWAELEQSYAETQSIVSLLQSNVEELNKTSTHNLTAGLQELEMELSVVAEFAKNVSDENRATFNEQLETAMELYRQENRDNFTSLKLKLENVSSRIQTFQSEIDPQLEDLHRESEQSANQISQLASNQLNISRQVDHLGVSVETQNLQIQRQLWLLNDSHHNLMLAVESWSLTDESRQRDAQNTFSQMNRSILTITDEVRTLWTTLQTTTTAIETNFTEHSDAIESTIDSLMAEVDLLNATQNKLSTEVKGLHMSIDNIESEQETSNIRLTDSNQQFEQTLNQTLNELHSTQEALSRNVSENTGLLYMLNLNLDRLDTTQQNLVLPQMENMEERVDTFSISLSQQEMEFLSQFDSLQVAMATLERTSREDITEITTHMETKSNVTNSQIQSLQELNQIAMFQLEQITKNNSLTQERLDSVNLTMTDQVKETGMALESLNQSARESTAELQSLRERLEELVKETHENGTLLVDRLMITNTEQQTIATQLMGLSENINSLNTTIERNSRQLNTDINNTQLQVSTISERLNQLEVVTNNTTDVIETQNLQIQKQLGLLNDSHHNLTLAVESWSLTDESRQSDAQNTFSQMNRSILTITDEVRTLWTTLQTTTTAIETNFTEHSDAIESTIDSLMAGVDLLNATQNELSTEVKGLQWSIVQIASGPENSNSESSGSNQQSEQDGSNSQSEQDSSNSELTDIYQRLEQRIKRLETQLNQSQTENTQTYQTDVEIKLNKLFEEIRILNTTANNFTISQAELAQLNTETKLIIKQLQSNIQELNNTNMNNWTAGLQELKMELSNVDDFVKNATTVTELLRRENRDNFTSLKLELENVSSRIQIFQSEIDPQLEDLHRESEQSENQISQLASNQLNISRQVDHLGVSVEKQNLQIQRQLWLLNDSHHNLTIAVESWSLSQFDSLQVAMATLERTSREDITEITTHMETKFNVTNSQIQSLQELNQITMFQLEQITKNNSLTQDRVETFEVRIQELSGEADERFTDLTNTQLRQGDIVQDVNDLLTVLREDFDNFTAQNNTIDAMHHTSTELRALDTKIQELNMTTSQSVFLLTASQSEFDRELVQVQSNIHRVDEKIDSLNQTQDHLTRDMVDVQLRLRNMQQSIDKVNDTVDATSIHANELSSTVQTLYMEVNTSQHSLEERLDSMNLTLTDQFTETEMALESLNQSARESTAELQSLRERLEELVKETHENGTLFVDQLMITESNIAEMKEKILSFERQNESSLTQLLRNQTQHTNQIRDLQSTISSSRMEMQEHITLVAEDVQRTQSYLNATTVNLVAVRGEIDTLALRTVEDITRLNSSQGMVQNQMDSLRSLVTDFNIEVDNSISQVSTEQQTIATQLMGLSENINSLNTTIERNSRQLNTDINNTQLQVSTISERQNQLEVVTNNTTAVIETQNLQIQKQLWLLNDSHYNLTLAVESWSLTDESRQREAQNTFSQMNRSILTITDEVRTLWTTLQTTTTAIETNFTEHSDAIESTIYSLMAGVDLLNATQNELSTEVKGLQRSIAQIASEPENSNSESSDSNQQSEQDGSNSQSEQDSSNSESSDSS